MDKPKLRNDLRITSLYLSKVAKALKTQAGSIMRKLKGHGS